MANGDRPRAPLLGPLLLLLLAAPTGSERPPPAPFFGPTQVWTPPWFAPTDPVTVMPTPTELAGMPGMSPWLIAQGIRSAVFNRLMPEGELYPGGPQHQLSDGRIFVPKWRESAQGFVPEWMGATAYKPGADGCGGPKREYYKWSGSGNGVLACEKKAVREAVRRGIGTKPAMPGECYQYGTTQYCLPSRMLHDVVPADQAPETDFGTRDGSLKDEAMGLIPRGPFPWRRLGLTTHELLDSGAPPGLLLTHARRTGQAAEPTPTPKPKPKPAAPSAAMEKVKEALKPSHGVAKAAKKVADWPWAVFHTASKSAIQTLSLPSIGHILETIEGPLVSDSALRGIPPFADYRSGVAKQDSRPHFHDAAKKDGADAAAAAGGKGDDKPKKPIIPRFWCSAKGCGVPLAERWAAQQQSPATRAGDPSSFQTPGARLPSSPDGDAGGSGHPSPSFEPPQRCMYGFPCRALPAEDLPIDPETGRADDLGRRWGAYLSNAQRREHEETWELKRKSPSWAEAIEFPELYVPVRKPPPADGAPPAPAGGAKKKEGDKEEATPKPGDRPIMSLERRSDGGLGGGNAGGGGGGGGGGGSPDRVWVDEQPDERTHHWVGDAVTSYDDIAAQLSRHGSRGGRGGGSGGGSDAFDVTRGGDSAANWAHAASLADWEAQQARRDAEQGARTGTLLAEKIRGMSTEELLGQLDRRHGVTPASTRGAPSVGFAGRIAA